MISGGELYNSDRIEVRKASTYNNEHKSKKIIVMKKNGSFWSSVSLRAVMVVVTFVSMNIVVPFTVSAGRGKATITTGKVGGTNKTTVTSSLSILENFNMGRTQHLDATITANVEYGYYVQAWRTTAASSTTHPVSWKYDDGDVQTELNTDYSNGKNTLTYSVNVPDLSIMNNYTASYTIKAVIARRAVEFNGSTPAKAPTITWKNRKDGVTQGIFTQDITMNHAYALNATDIVLSNATYTTPIAATAAFKANSHTSGDGNTDGSVKNYGQWGLTMVYKPTYNDLLTLGHGTHSFPNIALSAVGGVAGSASTTATGSFILDLSPVFSLPTENVKFDIDLAKTKDILPFDYGELPLESCTWTAAISGDDATSFTLNSTGTDGTCNVTFVPRGTKTDYYATLTVTAKYGDADPVVRTCILQGDPTKLEPKLLVTGVTDKQTLPQENLENTNVWSKQFTIEGKNIDWNWSDANVILSEKESFSYILSAVTQNSDKKVTDKRTLTISAVPAQWNNAQTKNITVQLKALSVTGSGETLTYAFTIPVKRWYVPITLQATAVKTNSVTLKWNKANYATSYIVEQSTDGGVTWPSENIVTVDKTALTHTYTNLLPDKNYTYRVWVVIDDINKKFETNHVEVTTSKDIDNISPDTKWENAGVDFSGAFDADGNPIMDVLYVLDKVHNKCYVYDVKITNNVPTSYVYRTTIDPTTQRASETPIEGFEKSNFPHPTIVGKRDNWRIYITGTCEKLFFVNNTEMAKITTVANKNVLDTEGDNVVPIFAGWMQPVNCELYLHDVRMRAAVLNDKKRVATITMTVSYSSDLSDWLRETIIPVSSSVFYLSESVETTKGVNNTTFHLLGNNYVGGGMGYNLEAYLDVTVDASFKARKMNDLDHFKPNYSAPIAIKDSSLFVASLAGNIPKIKASFDAKWADGTITNGYLDLSTRVAQATDSAENKLIPEPIVDNNKNELGYVHWTNQVGKRYAPALTTGGNHGTFEINGGHINLWPANGSTQDLWYQQHLGATNYGGIFDMWAALQGGRSTNYMVCGSDVWELICDENAFNPVGTYQDGDKKGQELEISDPTVTGIVQTWNSAPRIVLYGLGDTYPYGHFIVNGGTISANTDPKSFSALEGGVNVADDPTNFPNDRQPLFAPNVVITGGTFHHPVYGTTIEGHKTGGEDRSNPIYYRDMTWRDGVADFETDAMNKYRAVNAVTPTAQPVMRTPLTMANWDWTKYTKDISTDAEAENYTDATYLVNAGEVDAEGNSMQYPYGVVNVYPTGTNKDQYYFYLPDHCGFYKNYYVQSDETLEGFGISPEGKTYRPYNLTVDHGGEMEVAGVTDDGDNDANTFKVYGTPKYRQKFVEDLYHPIAMPFTATKFTVEEAEGVHTQINSYVENADAARAGMTDAERKAINNNAYCYLYFLDDNADDDNLAPATQTTIGVDDNFRKNYRTHANGSTMMKDKTYIIKFPHLSTAKFWEDHWVTLEGEKGKTFVNGVGAFTNPARPTEDDHFLMAGNATFTSQKADGNPYYMVLHSWGDDAFHSLLDTQLPHGSNMLAPMQGYILANDYTMKHRPVLGRYNGNNTTTGLGNTSAEWTVYAHGGYIYVTPVADSTMMLYTVDGQLVGTYPMVSGAQTIIPAAAGMYILRSGDAVAKVMVE